MVDQNKDKIITPLKIEVKEEKTVRFGVKRKNSLKLASLILSLIIMVVGALWLFSYLSRNHVRTVSVPAEKVTPQPQSKRLPDDIPSYKSQEDAGKARIAKENKEAEQKFARHNLDRAKNIETVMRLIASGANNEKGNNLSLAYADYQEAVRLDPESENAQSALNRVKNLIEAEQFQQLMSSGFTAFNSNDYERARSLFLRAQSFRPDSHEVKDALAQVDAAILLSRIEDLQKKALAAESSEDWKQSLASYQAVLKIDNSIHFAIQGKERSMKRSQLEKRMNYYLEKPSVLESDYYLKKAIELVKEAEKIEPKGPSFNDQLKRLDKLVKSAQIPVQVTIESDSMTEVVIYKVSKLGRFYMRELSLRPGTYTILGTRNGFKDVRQKISVKAGQDPIRITLKCGEKI